MLLSVSGSAAVGHADSGVFDGLKEALASAAKNTGLKGAPLAEALKLLEQTRIAATGAALKALRNGRIALGTQERGKAQKRMDEDRSAGRWRADAVKADLQKLMLAVQAANDAVRRHAQGDAEEGAKLSEALRALASGPTAKVAQKAAVEASEKLIDGFKAALKARKKQREVLSAEVEKLLKQAKEVGKKGGGERPREDKGDVAKAHYKFLVSTVERDLTDSRHALIEKLRRSVPPAVVRALEEYAKSKPVTLPKWIRK